MSLTKANKNPYKELDWISTGFANLDKILGGGVPTRKIVEFSGNASVGKSTLALHVVSEAQKLGMPCLWADDEYSFTESYAELLGVATSKLDLLMERFAETMLDEIEVWAEKHKNALIVLDSVGGLLIRPEAEKNAGEKVIGGQAKLIATFCRKIVPILAINNICLIVINHNFVDLMSGKLKTSGGAKLEYAKSIWLMLRTANKRLMQGENQVGMVIEAEMRKNKVGDTVKQKTELQMVFGQGFLKGADILQDALDKGVITKQGNTFSFQGEKLAVGLAKLREALKDEVLLEKIKAAL